MLNAAIAGNFVLVKQLIEGGADVNAVDENGKTLLHLAAIYGREEVAKYLIELGVDVNAKDVKKETPLIAAIKALKEIKRHFSSDPTNLKDQEAAIIKIMQFLIDKGVDLNAKVGRFGVLSLVAQEKELSNVAHLLLSSSRKSFVIAEEDLGAMNILLKNAIEEGNSDFVKLVILRGSRIFTYYLIEEAFQDVFNKACSANDIDVINRYCEIMHIIIDCLRQVKGHMKHYDQKAFEEKRYENLCYLAEKEKFDIVNFFNQKGMNTYFSPHRPVHLLLETSMPNPLRIALKTNQDAKIAKILIDNGASCTELDGELESILMAAIKNPKNDNEIIETIIDNACKKIGPRFYSSDKKEETPLHHAAMKNHKIIETILKVVKKYNFPVDDKNQDGDTALILAAKSKNSYEAIKLLIKYGANVNKKNNNRDTALHFAAKEGHAEVVQILLENGATVDAANKNGDTALHYAAQNGHAEMVNILLEKNAIFDAKNNKQETALDIATKEGYQTVINAIEKYHSKSRGSKTKVASRKPLEYEDNSSITVTTPATSPANASAQNQSGQSQGASRALIRHN